ncbi:Adenylate kinase [Sparganum proliferum]
MEVKSETTSKDATDSSGSNFRPISWVLDGLPPNVVVWEKIVEKSAEVRQALSTRRNTLEASRKAEMEAKRRAEEAMEEDEEGQQEKGPDPILEAARAAAETEKNKPMPSDPLPTFVFQLKDGLPDYALLMHRLYLMGYGPLKDVPRLVKHDNLVPAMEPMTDSQAAPTADDTTEAPPDLPASNVTFDPMPAPGPEVDYVLNWIRQFEAEWGKTTEFLGKTTSAYGYPAMFSDLDIGGKSYDDLYREISIAIQKPLQRPAKESSQDELDEKADAEAEAFAEGGLEDYKPPGEEEGEEEEAEEEEEEAKEEAEEGEEEEEEMQPEEDPSRGPTRQLGRTSYFCPVALREFQIMKPGDPEVVAEYLGKAYYFGTEEDRAKFLLEPTKYVDRGIQRPIKLPPLRICLLGPTGSGKSLHGRQLATRLNLIHISFPQLLQDIMLAKLHRNVGAQYADDKPIPLRVMPDLEEAVAKALALRENPDAEEAEPDPVGDAEPEALPEIPLNAHEQAIRSHLQDDEELPRESLDLLLKKFWATEPYMSSGIVLEGFPRNGEDVTYMQESNLFPDLCIAFMAEAEDIVSRLLPPRLAKWKIKQARLEANKKIEIEWKKARRLRLYEARKKQIMTELAVKRKAKLEEMRAKAKSPRPKSGDEEEEEQEPEENDDEDNILDEVNVDEMLTEEFPAKEEMEIESEETEAEATERLTEEITEQLETEIANADEVLEALTEIRIPHVTVKAADSITRVRFRLIKRIKSMIVNRQSLFERVYPLKPLEAERLVSSGFKHLSAFGKWCPVTWQDQMACRLPVPSVLSPLQHSRVKATALGPLPGTPLVELGVPKKRPTCAAVFREYVFWFQTPADRKKFIDNPLIYLQHKQLPLTHQPLRLAVIGAPKSGKTQLAKRIAKELGIVHLSASAAVNWILKSPSHQRTFLVEKIRDCIRGGNQLYDCLTAGAINVALMTPLAHYVLDGFPVTSEQAERLFDLNVRPILIIDLIARNSSDQVELVSRAIADAEKAMAALSPPVKEGSMNEEEEEMEEGEEAKVQTLEQRFGIPPLEVDIIQTQTLKQLALAEADKARKAWFKQHTGLLSEIVCTENRWIIYRKTQELITHRMAHVQEYLWSISRGKAASVAELGITPQEFEKQLSEFGYYCPVRLADDAELFDTADEVTCPQEIRLPVPSDKLDSALSSIIQPCVRHETGEANEEVENIKLCPTVYSEFRFGVEYNGKYYRVAGPRELEKFLANPERYLPPAASRKLPPPEEIPKRLIVDSDLLSRDQFPAQLCLRGYCSVCFQRSGLRYEGLVVGSKEFKAVLNGQLYAFCKRECLMEFLHKPWLYAHLRLPHKLPPAICPLSVRDLPLPGYLEQTVAYALRTALAICAQFRPKFPFISPRRSALIYTALQLKALNPQSPELFRKRAKERVENFEESCRLIEQLAAIMPIRFVNERDRSRELSTRLQRFLALRGKQDTADVWMEPVG